RVGGGRSSVSLSLAGRRHLRRRGLFGLHWECEESAHNWCLIRIQFLNQFNDSLVQGRIEHHPCRQASALRVAERRFITAIPAKTDTSFSIPHADGIGAVVRTIIDYNVNQAPGSFGGDYFFRWNMRHSSPIH